MTIWFTQNLSVRPQESSRLSNLEGPRFSKVLGPLGSSRVLASHFPVCIYVPVNFAKFAGTVFFIEHLQTAPPE